MPVILLRVGDEKIAVKLNGLLMQEGIYVECFRWPTVPEGEARIRIVPMATHRHEHLNRLIESLVKIRDREKSLFSFSVNQAEKNGYYSENVI